MIALPRVLDQAAVGTFQAALLRTQEGLRLHLADTRTGQDAWLSPDGARTLAGILALHPFPLAAVPLGEQAVACPAPHQVEIVQDGQRVGIPAHAAYPVRNLLEDLDRTSTLFDAP